MSRLTISGTGEAKSNVTIREILNELRYYEDLKEQGRLIELPCKVGDTVYNRVPRGNPPYSEDIITKIIIRSKGIFLCFETGLSKHINSLNNSLFLSREEAEKALKEMKEGETDDKSR